MMENIVAVAETVLSLLGHNRLVCVIGDELLHVPNLIELLLNNNLIEEIPQEVGALAKLRVLDVRLRIVSFPSYF